MNSITLRAIMTVVMFVTFIGIIIWAWSGRNKKNFEEAANLPFEGDEVNSRGENHE